MTARHAVLAVALIALAACGEREAAGPPSPPAPTAADAAGGPCNARAGTDWSPVAGAVYRIEAVSQSATCGTGVATLTVTDRSGRILYTGAHEIEPMTNTVFAESTTPQKLEGALADWIDPSGSTQMRTTRALPDWPRGADGPVSGEFPFYPAEGTTRDAWIRLRAQDKPLYCFVQGGESMQCLALDVGAATLTPVGLQTFPG